MSDCMEAVSVSGHPEKTVTGGEKLGFSGFDIVFQNFVSDIGEKVVSDNNKRVINKSSGFDIQFTVIDIECFFCFKVFRKFINP